MFNIRLRSESSVFQKRAMDDYCEDCSWCSDGSDLQTGFCLDKDGEQKDGCYGHCPQCGSHNVDQELS